MIFASCEDVSPNQTPPLTTSSSPEPTEEPTKIPGQTPISTTGPEFTDGPVSTESPNPTEEPSITPELTESPAPVAEPTGTPQDSPEPTSVPAITPEETPEPTPTPFSVGLIISEIMYNPKSPDADWEWIEVYNGTSEDINVAGWVVDDGNKTPHAGANIAGGIIPAYGTGVLFNSDVITSLEFETAWGDNINLIPVTGWGNMGLNNTGDKIGIWESYSAYDEDHELFLNAVCMIEYVDEAPWPADDGAGSIYLTELTMDYTEGALWALSVAGDSTPLGNCTQSTETGTNSGADIGSP